VVVCGQPSRAATRIDNEARFDLDGRTAGGSLESPTCPDGRHVSYNGRLQDMHAGTLCSSQQYGIELTPVDEQADRPELRGYALNVRLGPAD